MKLSLVIPIYNEEKILASVVERLVRECDRDFPGQYEIILAENGSRDGTLVLGRKLSEQFTQVRVISAGEPNYGLALKTGLKEARGEYIIGDEIDICDTDFYHRALAVFSSRSCDMVIGSKRLSTSHDQRPWIRRCATACITAILKFGFGLKVSDTHGLKVMRRAAILPIVARCVTEKDLFASELVIRAEQARLQIVEIPITIQENRKTPISIFKRIPNVCKNLIRLRWAMTARKDLVCATVVFVLAYAAILFYGFPDSAPPWFDEGVNLGIAKTFAQDGVFSLRLAPGEYVAERSLMITTSYPVLAPIAVVFWLFGAGVAQAKVVMMVFLTAFLAVAARVVYKLAGGTAALIALALCVTFLPLYGNGLGGGLGEIPGLLYLCIGLLLLRHQKPSYLFIAGLAFGLCAATKVLYATILLPLLCGEIWRAITLEKGLPWRRWSLLLVGVAGPLILWVVLLLPGGADGSSLATTLAYYANPYQQDTAIVANLKRFVTETTPAHCALLFFFYGIVRYLRRREWQWTETEIILLGFVAIDLLFYVQGPGWYRYFFPAHMIALLLFPMALVRLCSGVLPRAVRHACILGTILLIGIQGIMVIRARGGSMYYDPGARLFVAALTETVGAGGDIFFLDQPALWFLFSGRGARQSIQINPYVRVGEDFFAEGTLPERLITGAHPQDNAYLRDHASALSQAYNEPERYGRYTVFHKRSHP